MLNTSLVYKSFEELTKQQYTTGTFAKVETLEYTDIYVYTGKQWERVVYPEGQDRNLASIVREYFKSSNEEQVTILRKDIERYL